MKFKGILKVCNYFKNTRRKKHLKIAIDFDGTCVKNKFPLIGEDIGAVPVLKKWVSQGHQLILFTMRSGVFLKQAVEWFKKNGIELYGIQYDPHQKLWTTTNKAFAHIYIDDSALGCPLIINEDLPYVDWLTMDRLFDELYGKGVINDYDPSTSNTDMQEGITDGN